MALDESRPRERVPEAAPRDVALGPDVPFISDFDRLEFDADGRTDLVGTSDYAEIHRAFDPVNQLTVALKTLKLTDTTSDEMWERMLAEARRAGAIGEHPNIANPLGWGEDPWPWLAMEFFEGGTLADGLASMGLHQRLWTAYALTDAVFNVHSTATGHHDIKPTNVLLKRTPEGMWEVPKLTDFGTGRELTERRHRLSNSTKAYAAPEMLPGTDAPIDIKTDIYQLGVVCYEIITGERPDHRTGDVTPPSALVDLQSAVDDIVLTAMAHAREERFEHTYAFREELDSVITETLVEGGERAPPTRTGGGGGASTSTAAGSERSTEGRRSAAADGVWRMYRGDPARTGRKTAVDGVEGPVDRRWHRESAPVRSTPAVFDGRLVFGSQDGSVSAVRTDTGAELWSTPTDDMVASSPAIADGSVVVGSRDGGVYALDATTGEIEWVYETDFWVSSSPVVADGVVYVGSSDYSVYALDADSGGLLWEFPTEGEIGRSSPALYGDLVVVGSNDGNVYGIDANTGAERWRFETDFRMCTTPAVADDRAFVGSVQNRLYALDASTGELEWTFHTGESVRSAPAVGPERAVFGSDDGSVYAVDRRTGESSWEFPTNDWVQPPPTIVDETVYVGNELGNVYALGLGSGRPAWRHQTNDRVHTAPVVVDGLVIVGTEGGLVALETA